MTDGGWENAKESQIEHKRRIRCGHSSSSIDQFGHSVAKITVAQILESANFFCSYRAPIDTLAGVMVRYISHLGKLAVSNANLSGRTDCNVFDVIQALEDIGSMHGFLGQSDFNRCLSNSGVIRDLYRFVGIEKEIPFSRSIPTFPVSKDSKATPLLFHEIGEEQMENYHIPCWLPAFPDPKTYANDKLVTDKDFEMRKHEKKQERSFFRLQKLFASSSGSVESSTDMETGTEKGKRAVQNNPFLVPPFPFEESKGISVISTSVPEIEASKEEKSEIVTRESDEISRSKEKSVVRFRIRVPQKPVTKALAVKDKNMEKGSWFERGDEMDLKKMKAELTLKESMDPNN